MKSLKKYILFHKPYGVLSQFSGDEYRTLAEFGLPKDVYPVGRLDKDSEGLLLLSNDGPFIEQFLLEHPRVYWAQVEKVPSEEAIKTLSQGVKIKSGMTKPCKIQLIEEPILPDRDPPIRFRKTVPTAWLELTLREGKNRQVRKMTAVIQHPTLRLFRSGLGKVRYEDHPLKQGEWKEISKSDLI